MKIDDKDKLRFRAIKVIQRSEIDKSVDEIYDRDDFVFRLYERSEFKCILNCTPCQGHFELV